LSQNGYGQDIYIYIQERTLKRKRCLGKLYQRDPN
jgi:hypothetical protein